MTNCQFILENKEFDYIDDELINSNIICSFPHYENGKGCTSCSIYRQIMESKNPQIEEDEEIQKNIQEWWT